MSFKTILVHANSVEELDRVVPVALKVATESGGHVIGLHVIPSPEVYPAYRFDFPVDVQEKVRKRAKELADTLQTRFAYLTDGQYGVTVDWRTIWSQVPDIDEDVIDHARCCDLLVLPQPDSRTPSGQGLGAVGRVILQTGRPVLMVPYAGDHADFGKHVFVAWNGSRESSRAVFDAMPFLLNAQDVRLYAVKSKAAAKDMTALQGAELATTLARHDITVVADSATPPETTVASDLLSRITDHGADLLVMGGYGHSRAREYIFGGVTREILKTMTVPVLFSH